MDINFSQKWLIWTAWIAATQWLQNNYFKIHSPQIPVTQSLLKALKAKENRWFSMSTHSANRSQMLNDTYKGEPGKSQQKSVYVDCLNLLQYSLPIPTVVLWTDWTHSKPWKLQLSVYRLYFHGNLKNACIGDSTDQLSPGSCTG